MNKTYKAFAVVYLLSLLYCTFVAGQRNVLMQHQEMNWVPLKSKRYYLDNFYTLKANQYWFLFKDTVGNFLLFLPYPWAVTVLTGKRFAGKAMVFIILASTFAIETLQYVFRVGHFDVDDIVLNLLGGMAGMVLYKLFLRRQQ